MSDIKETGLSHQEAEAIIAGDLQRDLPTNVRKVMLDVVLTWANLDMATTFFVASVSHLSPDEGAEKFGRKEIAEKLKRAGTALAAEGKHELASNISQIAADYPAKALLRRRIAHTRCAGVRKSLPNRLVFMPFEREGPPGQLAIEIFDISAFAEAEKWAREVHEYLMLHIDEVDFFKIR